MGCDVEAFIQTRTRLCQEYHHMKRSSFPPDPKKQIEDLRMCFSEWPGPERAKLMKAASMQHNKRGQPNALMHEAILSAVKWAKMVQQERFSLDSKAVLVTTIRHTRKTRIGALPRAKTQRWGIS